ncbi:hypothetical protein ACT2EB_18440 [Salmonella enterica subsp. enterica serovar Typhimurium]|nr:hypothetical protein [Salmonella enterica]
MTASTAFSLSAPGGYPSRWLMVTGMTLFSFRGLACSVAVAGLVIS